MHPLVAAWDRLKKLDIPGIPLDQRFNLNGPTFYLSPNGDDTAQGSKDHPCRTLQFAVTKLEPDTVIYLMAGITTQPRFVDAARLDFRLQSGSPCIDAGDPKVTDHFFGQAPDIGLYETTIGFSPTYTTRFEGAENPLSEGGRWTNQGVDWTNIRKKNGLAFGTQTGTNTGIPLRRATLGLGSFLLAMAVMASDPILISDSPPLRRGGWERPTEAQAGANELCASSRNLDITVGPFEEPRLVRTGGVPVALRAESEFTIHQASLRWGHSVVPPDPSGRRRA